MNGKAGALGETVSIARDKAKLTVTAELPFSKRYLKYLTKKHLKKQQLRDYLRVRYVGCLPLAFGLLLCVVNLGLDGGGGGGSIVGTIFQLHHSIHVLISPTAPETNPSAYTPFRTCGQR